MEVNGEPVSREKFAAYVTRIAEVIDEIAKEGKPHPSVFEIETAAAFLYFRDEKCDLVLMMPAFFSAISPRVFPRNAV